MADGGKAAQGPATNDKQPLVRFEAVTKRFGSVVARAPRFPFSAAIPIANLEKPRAGASPCSAQASQTGRSPQCLISRIRAGPGATTSVGLGAISAPTTPTCWGLQKVSRSSRVIRSCPDSAVIAARRYQVVRRGAIVGSASSRSIEASADSGSSDANAGSRRPCRSISRRSRVGDACSRTFDRAVPMVCLSSRQAIADNTGASSSDAAIAYSRNLSRRAIGPSQDRRYTESSVSK